VCASSVCGELVDFPSPDDETVIFSVKRCSVADNIKRQNLASTVRYVNEDDGARFVTERDYPVGDLKIATVTLALGGWEYVDDNNGAPQDQRTHDYPVS
jgi:hypothetical protein